MLSIGAISILFSIWLAYNAAKANGQTLKGYVQASISKNHDGITIRDVVVYFGGLVLSIVVIFLALGLTTAVIWIALKIFHGAT